MEANIKEWTIGECVFKVTEVDGETHLKDFWFSVMNINIGKPKGKLPDRYYLVCKKDNSHLNYTPYMLVELCYDHNPYFPTYTLWHNYLLIARFEDFYYIDLLSLEVHKFPTKESEKFLYFGDFYQEADRLLFASESCLYCFDENLTLIWQTEEIACDGVLVHGYEDGYLDVHGENDPPGGWIQYKVEFATGKAIKLGWVVTDDYNGLAKAFDEEPEFIFKQLAQFVKSDKSCL